MIHDKPAFIRVDGTNLQTRELLFRLFLILIILCMSLCVLLDSCLKLISMLNNTDRQSGKNDFPNSNSSLHQKIPQSNDIMHESMHGFGLKSISRLNNTFRQKWCLLFNWNLPLKKHQTEPPPKNIAHEPILHLGLYLKSNSKVEQSIDLRSKTICLI